MDGSESTRSARRLALREGARHVTALSGEGVPGAVVPAPASLAPSSMARIELAALEAELAYRGPERRNGPGAGLAKLLASVLDEVDYGLVLMAADGHVVHANHAARVELAGAKSLQLVGRRLSGRSASDQRALDEALAGA